MAIPKDVWEKELINSCKKHKAKLIESGRIKNSNCTIKCACGNIETKYASFYISKGALCSVCRHKKMRLNQSLVKRGKQPHNTKSITEYKKQLKKANPNIVCLGEYVNCKTPTLHRCIICNHEQTYLPINILRFGCRSCAGLVPKTTESYNKELSDKGLPYKAISYDGARTPVTHICTRCNEYKVEAMPTNALKKDKLRCPICDKKTVYSVRVRSKIYRVRGYERFAIKQIIKRFGVKNVKCDLSGGVPNIVLNNGKRHRPDFYIESENLLIEVKSLVTFGLGDAYFGKSPSDILKENKGKRKAALKQGYKYLLLLLNSSGEQIKIPKDWHLKSASFLKRFIY